MYTVKELKEELKPIGKMNLFNMEKEINYLQEILKEKEMIKGCAEAYKGMKLFLIVLTDKRLMTISNKAFKGINFNEYDINEIKKLYTERISGDDAILFEYLGEKVKIQIHKNSNNESFALDLEKKFGSQDVKLTGQPINIKKSIKTKGSPKTYIEILNGKEQLGYKGGLFQIIQETPGEVRFKVDYNDTNDVFHFIKYERTENIKKSALDVAGWTFAGSLFGSAGALAGGLGAQAGKDKSTAAIFLINKITKQKIMLIIKCDSKILGKLSLFIPMQDGIEEPENKVSFDKYEQLDRLATLKEKSVLSDEEFQQEKEKILNNS